MYDIFLSYSSKDRERLMPLVKAFEQQGWTVFWDHQTVPIGKHWQNVIGQAIRDSRCVVVAWSAHSVASEWVIEEALEGKKRGVLLPIRLDNVEIPFGFGVYQSGNFIGWNGGADYFEFIRLSKQIRVLVGEKTATPVWAGAAGDDLYGHFADLNVKGIIQRFRRIEPGTFLMGSPLSEPGRYDDEIQHEVSLTQGFWLADTACTQALWQVVMGSNPARFNDKPNNPVENVSWDDVQGFIQKLNALTTGLNLRLPTEAQWEYACRAGTTTAFHFGGKNELNLKRVNYSGKWDGVNLGGETKAVKSYAPNDWGLYEMHGNVWEWCQDWYGDYPAKPVKDPQGAELGTLRVLRGGSWFYLGRCCCSARRARDGPASRSSRFGFRLSLGL